MNLLLGFVAKLPMKTSIIHHKTIVEQVLDAIRDSIARGDFQVGDKLPTESELADYLVKRIPSVYYSLDFWKWHLLTPALAPAQRRDLAVG